MKNLYFRVFVNLEEKMNDKKVSIIIPTYKRADRIQRAVDSVLKQTYQNIEILVIDDNDPTSIERKYTEAAMKKYAILDNVIYIKHEKNKNGSAARNTGIRNSVGDYITFLDDDDEYFANKVEAQVDCMEKLTDDWAMCYTSYQKVDQYNRMQFSSETSEGYIPVQVLSKNLYIGSGSNFLIRRENVIEVNGFDETYLRNQDLEFMSRILINYKIKYVDVVGFLIHNEIRESKFTYEEIKKINDQYRKKFSSIFNKLDYVKQLQIKQLLDLNDIRLLITNKKIVKTLILIRDSNIPISVIVRYFSYLFKRVITKESFGFKLREEK